MTEQDLLAQEYLRPPTNAIWCWSPEGNSVDWNGGGTIAFRAELIACLRRLADTGLPPFDSLILVLAACRTSWPEYRSLGGELLQTSRDKFLIHAIEELLVRLDNVSELPVELRSELPAKLELLAAVFDRYPHRASREASWQIVASLVAGLECGRLASPLNSTRTSLLVKERRLLSDALSRLDEASLRLRLKTGLDRVIQAPPEETTSEPNRPLTIYELLLELEQDPEHAGLVRLVRNLLAVTYLPRRVDEPMELAMGGVSDITNRGPYDRLLISELAHDDDTLMTRVALNEALYLRRETPPSNPAQTRLVLIDPGIRMWGLPRLYATGVALSLAAQRGYHGETRLFHPRESDLSPIDLTSPDGIVQHLSLLSPAPHPGHVLAAFGELATQLTAETILITCEDVWRDPLFRQQLRESGIAETFVFTVERSGRLRAFRQTIAGEKPIREAHLDLAQLLKSPASPTQLPAPLTLREPDSTVTLPEFFQHVPAPLRIPHSIRWKQSWSDPKHGLFSVTSDQQLTLWNQQGLGPVILCDALPARRLLWAQAADERGTSRFVVASSGRRKYWSVSVSPSTEKPVEWQEIGPVDHDVLGVAHHRDVLFLIGHRQITEFSIPSSRRIASWTLPAGFRWSGHGRFFRKGWELHALATGSTLERICSRIPHLPAPDTGIARVRWTAIEGPDGPVAVDEGGTLYSSSDDSMKRVHPDLKGHIHVTAVSVLGTAMVVEPKFPYSSGAVGPHSRYLIAPWNGNNLIELRPAIGDPQQWVTMSDARYGIWQRSLRKNITQIAVSRGLLHLRCRSGIVLQLTPNLKLEMLSNPAESLFDGGQPELKPVPGWTRQFPLSVATWADGSRIFLDGRGLLHLVSSDPRLPQVSFLLSETVTAGWTSHHNCWGQEFFLANLRSIFQTRPAEFIWDSCLEPILKRFGN